MALLDEQIVVVNGALGRDQRLLQPYLGET
jgi:hypothetical protein